jgi:hypothetical protein
MTGGDASFPITLVQPVLAQHFVNKIIPLTKYCIGAKECFIAERQYLGLIFFGQICLF